MNPVIIHGQLRKPGEANHGEETGTCSMLPVSEGLKAEIADCRETYRSVHGAYVGAGQLIKLALIRYRQDLEHILEDRREFTRAKMGPEVES